MKKKIISILATVMMVCSSLFCFVPAMADNSFNNGELCNGASEEVKKAIGCSESRTAGEVAKDILNVVISIVGIIAVIVIIICGILMATSAGDASRAAKAKKGLIYAIVGLLVAILSWAIVNFVLAGVFQ